jgi:hypothetical protein
MALSRALACLGIVAAALTAAAPAGASSTDACAQRVIRDWYDGGRVDGVYPLRCYRAAIQALPEDVLQYSDARNEIERALAYAAQSARDRARRSVAPLSRAAAQKERPPVARSELAARSRAPKQAATRPAPARPASAPATGAPPRAFDDPVRLAARDDVRVADAQGLPYPVVVLATLAALLLATAAAARVMTRRRASGSTPDR